MCGLSLTYSAVISGFKNKDQGNSFFKAYDNYINQNWAQSLAISMALTMTTFYISNGCSFCFKKGTMVLTEDGYKKIEEIEVGDKVLSFNEDTGDSDYKEVVRLFRNTTEKWVHIDVNGETITCTPEHPFYILNAEDTPIVDFEGRDASDYQGQWVKAESLKIGHKVLLSNGKNGIINSVETEDLDDPVATYNFEVQDYHTYYVGSEGILVHNACGGENNILKNIEYTDKVKGQMLQDVNHGFPSMIDDIAGVHGNFGTFTGNDGVIRTAVELPGAFNGKIGIYQYIIEPNGVTVNHRLFTTIGKSLLGG